MYNFLPIFRMVTELDQQGKRKLWSYFARLDEADQSCVLQSVVEFQGYQKNLTDFPSTIATLNTYRQNLDNPLVFFLLLELTAIEYFRTIKGRELRQTRQYKPTRTEPKRNTMAFRVKTFYA